MKIKQPVSAESTAKMGSGISGQESVAKVEVVGEMPNTERKLSIKFPSNYALEAFHKFRDVRLKDVPSYIDFSDDGGKQDHRGGRDNLGRVDTESSSSALAEKQPINENADIIRPGIYTKVYSYYHWKNKYVDPQ